MLRNVGDILLLVLNAAWRRRWLICVPVLILPVLGLLAHMRAPITYESQVSILISNPTMVNPFVKDDPSNPKFDKRMDPLKRLLKSEIILTQVLEELGEIDDATPEKDRREKVKNLNKSISTSLVGKEMVNITMKSDKDTGLARTLDILAKHFIERVIVPEQEAINESNKYLDAQLEGRRQELLRAERRLADFKIKNSENLPDIYQSNIKRLLALQSLLDEKLADLGAAQAAYDDFKKRLSGTNPLIGKLEEQIVEASSELVTLRSRYTDQHSKVIDVKAKLDRLQEKRSQLLAQTRNVDGEDLDRLFNMALGVTGSVDGEQGQSPFLVSQIAKLEDARSQRSALEQEVTQLRSQINRVNTNMARFGPVEREFQELERDIKIAEDLYEKLIEKTESARVRGALGKFGAADRVRVVSRPVDPEWPSSPGKMLYIIGGIAGGIFLGIGLAAVTELLDPTVRSAKELAHATDLPILTRLSYISLPESWGGDGPDGPYPPNHPVVTGKRTWFGHVWDAIQFTRPLFQLLWPMVLGILKFIWSMLRPGLRSLALTLLGRFPSLKSAIQRRW